MPDKQLYFGGEISTVDESCSGAEAVAVADGVIVEVGSEKECRAALGKDFEAVDLKGGALLPGFIDTHLHPVLLSYFDFHVNLRGISSLEELQDKLHRKAVENPAEEWIVGLDFNEVNLKVPVLPSRHDLDQACANRPVIIIKHDGHMVIANTKAIETMGISSASPDPEGGVIDRESDGYPAGPFRETAAQAILSGLPLPDLQIFMDSAAATFRKLSACGITSAGVVMQTGEEGPSGKSGAFDAVFMQLVLSRVPFSLYGLLITGSIEEIEALKDSPLHSATPGGHRIGALKIIADGSFGSCTAFMREPFTDQPDKRGFLVLPPEEIYRRMVEAHKAGLQIAIHAIGDAANRTCIDLYKRLLQEHPKKDHRHRLEHASTLDAGMLTDISRMGLVISTQPLFVHSEKHWLYRRLGQKRAAWTYPYRSILNAGIKLAGASDAPIESFDVIHALSCSVTREGFEEDQCLTAAEAIRMYTIDAAYAQFEETVKGSITKGKRADMVVLSANPVSVQPEQIKDIRVRRTIVGGKTVFEV